jgi:ubiquinone/menaquinone biosynthesis C-methylase UbiE
MDNYNDWKRIYKEYPLSGLPWELGRPREVLLELIESGLIEGERVLDLCCGAGTNTIDLAQKGFVVDAIDISPDAIAHARERAEESGMKINFVTGSFLDLPFDDETFDFIFDFGCFHHVYVEDRKKFIKGVHSVLKTGGIYQLTCFSHRNGPSWNHFTEKEIRDYFSWDSV